MEHSELIYAVLAKKDDTMYPLLLLLAIAVLFLLPVIFTVIRRRKELEKYRQEQERHRQVYNQLEKDILDNLGMSMWQYAASGVCRVYLKSTKSMENYTIEKFAKEHFDMLQPIRDEIIQRVTYSQKLNDFLNEDNPFKTRELYDEIANRIADMAQKTNRYYIVANYTSPAGNVVKENNISIDVAAIDRILADPSLRMSKSEYNNYLKTQAKEQLQQKQKLYYDKINSIIDTTNENRSKMIRQSDATELDTCITSIFNEILNQIEKIKDLNSEKWQIIDNALSNIQQRVDSIIRENDRILAYYSSPDFLQIKSTCDTIMTSQKEFNDYIREKAKAIETLFGARVVRNQTETNDKYAYIRPYEKHITPFTAEVSAQVFASAENNPLDYVIKYFYPNKEQYPEQIQKLQQLINELETLREAKQIIDMHKQNYTEYMSNVPDYVLAFDENKFYEELGLVNIDEETLTVEYKFQYTSNGGMAQRSFTIPMTEETIIQLIEALQSKLTMSAFTKEQRSLMTKKLRDKIKERDNYTCKYCGNSLAKEPNLLLEIDHILPVSKGGYTIEENLQTLCWRCNRSKSNKVM